MNLIMVLSVLVLTACTFELPSKETDTPVVEPNGPAIVIISEFGEGTSNNKAIELANIGESTADLADYRLAFYYNDSIDADYIELNGMLSKGSTFVLIHSSFDFTSTCGLNSSWSFGMYLFKRIGSQIYLVGICCGVTSVSFK